MLHLVRNLKDDGIVITTPDGNQLKFYVTKVMGSCVTLSFESFKGFQVDRGEVLERKKEEGNGNH